MRRDADAIADHFRLTRRQMLMLGSSGLAALAFGLSARPARAVGNVALGDAEVTIVSDGTLTLPLSFIAPDVPKDELDALLKANGMATDAVTPDCNVTFLRSGDRLVVFDVGSGSNFMPTAGKLLANLEETGIDPSEVTDVVFTHAHPDHLWGLVDDFDEMIFPEANYYIGQAEWDFWRADDTLAAMPEERKTFVVGAQSRLAVLEDRINLINPGAEVVPGVEAIDTSGHTPGHLSYMLHGGSEQLLVIGDAISSSVISFAHPEWPYGSDQDPQKGIETRTALIDRLASDKAHVVGYHLPHPGKGRVEKDGTAYRFAAG
ncbi:MBL fold metallo-hydrolase [Zhengella mangrovi]|nr:MBL fold metallo-hydrolase [Zhengella mangrovi]